ncbi:MAG: response regulator [Beijerinckiaceae bacterium]|nr:response regulator [Beijerinckiaceae bacterium]
MSRRILLIEDDPISQDIIRSLLTGQGHEVDVVTDGFSALDRARRTRYDAALIDYHLPEMDGYTLGRLLCEQHPSEGATPVLIGLTADRNGLAARRGSDAVFRAILPKPIKPAELFETLERLCAGAQAGGSGATGAAPREATLSLWRNHGLGLHPRACICPAPTPEQATALALCFELVEPAQAELVLLLERHGINEAIRISRRDPDRKRPVIGLSDDHADICDGLFKVAEPQSWRKVATLLGAGPGRVAAPAPAEASVIVLTPPAAKAEAPSAPAAEPAPQVEPVARTAPAGAPGPALRPILLDGVATPLSTLRSAIESHLRRPPAEASGAHDLLTRALASLSEVLLVTETVVDFLKEPAPQDASLTGFDPAELVENAVTMIRDVAPAGAPRLAWRIDASVPGHVRGDAHRLSQILLTMLDDAAHLGPGAATLHVGFADGDDPALGFRLAYLPDATAETGAGSQRDAGVIAQLRTIRSATLRRLIALVGGDVAPQERASGPLTGFTLPATREAAPARTSPARMSPGVPGGGQVATGARVLLVDDGAVGGEMLTLLLAQAGHNVCRAPDIEAASFVATGSRQDVALVDVSATPAARETALTALRGLRQAHAAMPLIVIASGLSDQDHAGFAALGQTTLLAKPFSPETLAGAIADALREPARPDAPTPAPAEPALDHAVHDALVAALGQASVERLTRQLLGEIATLAEAEGFDAQRAGRIAELASCAGMLGLADLNRACAATGREPAACAAVRTALTRAQAAVAALRMAA